jgi:hypothetical protein
MASTLAGFESSGFLPVGTYKTLVHAATVDNEEALHNRTVEACQTTRNYPAIFEQMQQCMISVDALTDSHGEHFEHLL